MCYYIDTIRLVQELSSNRGLFSFYIHSAIVPHMRDQDMAKWEEFINICVVGSYQRVGDYTSKIFYYNYDAITEMGLQEELARFIAIRSHLYPTDIPIIMRELGITEPTFIKITSRYMPVTEYDDGYLDEDIASFQDSSVLTSVISKELWKGELRGAWTPTRGKNYSLKRRFMQLIGV